MDRITQEDLNNLIVEINTRTESPMTPYTKTDKGFAPNIGHYHVDYSEGHQLARFSNKGGGVTIISSHSVRTKQQLYHWMQAFIAGIKL